MSAVALLLVFVQLLSLRLHELSAATFCSALVSYSSTVEQAVRWRSCLPSDKCSLFSLRCFSRLTLTWQVCVFVELERRNWVHFVVSVFGAGRKRLKRVVHP